MSGSVPDGMTCAVAEKKLPNLLSQAGSFFVQMESGNARRKIQGTGAVFNWRFQQLYHLGENCTKQSVG